MKEKEKRFRNFATVVYPDSCKEDWFSIIDNNHYPCYVSPLHDKDINPDGELKKAHYHVLFKFEGIKSYSQAEEIVKSLNGVGLEIVTSLRGYARYLCHLDNPEKVQYAPELVRCFGGLDWLEDCSLASDRYKAIQDMIDFCCDNDIISYSKLLEYCRLERFDWFKVLCDNGTYVIKEYLKSRSWDKQNQADDMSVELKNRKIIEDEKATR